ncbi:hypothetical protein BCR44DRAFT_368888 [Catenaria anguillulae PL171]|uniref:DUF6604 domain-containing protein n=1 Tax=Catenaria anguillulae PL171 TaxID=765915 RepID=A0A1Y2HZ75_9FUNG|nr:hypothetical protein BCR44DRAFT_368888 [Catenaria anguillulae PL171]
MQLPDTLFTKYRQYKKNTDRFVNWLSQTARRSGYLADPEDQSKLPNRPSSAPVSTSDIVTFAKVIVNASVDHPHPIRVPPHVLKWATSAIDARRACADWFLTFASAHGSEARKSANVSAQNLAHVHFIRVLETAVSILTPLAHRRRDPPASSGDPGLANRFASLDADETNDAAASDHADGSSESDDDSTTSASSSELQPPTSCDSSDDPDLAGAITIEDTELSEMFLAVFFFFSDLQQLRSFVMDSWEQYRDGKLDLVTASLTTTFAVDLVRTAQVDCFASFDIPFKDYDSITRFVFGELCLARGKYPEFSVAFCNDEDESMWPTADFMFMSAAGLAKEVGHIIRSFPIDREIISVDPEQYGVYDPLVDRTKLSGKDKVQENRVILLSLLGYIHNYRYIRNQDLVIHDTFIQELVDTSRGRRPTDPPLRPFTAATAFAVQVFFDTHSILRSGVDGGFTDLYNASKLMLDTHFELLANRPPGFTWPSYSFNFGQFARLGGTTFAWTQTDHLEHGYPKSPNPPRARLLRNHPWLCGLLLYRTLMLSHEFSVAIGVDFATVSGAVHLYEFGKRKGLIPGADGQSKGEGPWADLDFVVAMHGRSAFFGKDAPTMSNYEAVEAFLSTRKPTPTEPTVSAAVADPLHILPSIQPYVSMAQRNQGPETPYIDFVSQTLPITRLFRNWLTELGDGSSLLIRGAFVADQFLSALPSKFNFDGNACGHSQVQSTRAPDCTEASTTAPFRTRS